MFITEQELRRLQQSSLYKDLPLAAIFCKEFKRLDKFKEFNDSDFSNFFSRFSEKEIEIMFPDQSYLLIRFNDRKAYVTFPSNLFFDAVDIP